ncbi:MAG: hypothetical protein ACRD3W_04670, partial [Terriglobales bacterium]
LEDAHRVSWNIGNQDFEAYALFLGLLALDQSSRARVVLTEYVDEHRTSRRCLSKEIVALLTGFGASLDTADTVSTSCEILL